jgi:hypothetical protein
MTEDGRARLLARIRETPSPTRAQHRTRSLAAAAVAAAITIALFLALGGVRAGGAQAAGVELTRPRELMLVTWLGAAAIAAVALWSLASRGRSMLGRRRFWLAGFSALAVGSLLMWKWTASSQFVDMTQPWPTRAGLRCLGLCLLLGLWPLAALAFARRRSDPLHPRATGAALGVAAGATTWLLVDLWCPVAYLPHLLLGHVLPIVFLALAGAAVASRWIAMART